MSPITGDAPREKVSSEHAQNAQIQIHPTHAQTLIRTFALHWYNLYGQVIMLTDSERPDQTARMRRLIWAFAVRIMPKDTFSHRAAHKMFNKLFR